MRAVLLSLVVCMMLISCTSVPLLGTPTMDAEEYEVYRTVIEPTIILDQTEIVVIMDHTATDKSAQELEESLAKVAEEIIGIEDETINNYRDANGESHVLGDDLDLGFKYVLISEEERSKIFFSEVSFSEMYPHSRGIMTVSRVGFSRERDQALVYVGYWLVGEGYYVFLTKEDGVWRIQQKRLIWIS